MNGKATASKPSKPWRVNGGSGTSTFDFRSQRAAYDHVKAIIRAGHKARIYHWEDGRWALYEKIDQLDA